MADNKIPVLTEVYNPKKSPKSTQVIDMPLEVTAELVAKVTAQVKPRLEAEITDFVLDELRSEIKKAREEIISSTRDFIDKSKADLKTELPSMYQESVKLAQINLNEKFADLHVDATAKFDASLADIADFAKQAVQADIRMRVNESFEQGMEEFQPKALADNKVALETQLVTINQEAQHALTQQLNAFQEQIIARHEAELSNSLNEIQQAANDSAEKTLRIELEGIQEKLMVEHQKQLNESLEGYLQTKGEAAEQDLLKKMQAYQEKLRIDYQEELSTELTAALDTIAQTVEESTQEQTGIMYSQVGTIQQETFAKLREEFNAEKTGLFNTASDEIKTTFTEQMTDQGEEVRRQFLAQVNGDLPDVQVILRESIEAILAIAVPDLEGRLKVQLTQDLQQLLLTVKFVLPE